jgi:hypothetical protein
MSVATLVRLSLEAVAEDQKVVSDHRPQGNTDLDLTLVTAEPV